MKKCDDFEKDSSNPNYFITLNELRGRVMCIHNLWRNLRERLAYEYGQQYFELPRETDNVTYEFGASASLWNIWLNSKGHIQATVSGFNKVSKLVKRRNRQPVRRGDNSHE